MDSISHVWNFETVANTSSFAQRKNLSWCALLPNRPFAQLLSGLETGHPAAASPSSPCDFGVFDEQKAVFLVSVSDFSECDSSGLDHLNSSWSNVRVREYFRGKIGHSWTARKPSFLNGKCAYIVTSHSTDTAYKPPVSLWQDRVWVWILETQVGASLVWKSTWKEKEDTVDCRSRKGLLRRLRLRLPPLVIQTLFLTCIRPALEYGSVAWSGLGKSNSERLERLQRTAARLITGTRVYEHLPRQLLLARAGLDRLDDRRYVKCGIIGFKLIYRKERLPGHLTAYAEVWLGSVPERTSSMNSRSQSNSTALRLPQPQTEILKSSPFYHCFTILNSIPIENLSSIAYLSTYLENSRQTSIV